MMPVFGRTGQRACAWLGRMTTTELETVAGFAGGHRQARGADYGFPAHK